MNDHPIALSLVILLLTGALVILAIGRGRAQHLARMAIEERNHWKRNYDIVSERLVRMERALRLRVKLSAEDRVSPAFARIEAEIKRLIPSIDEPQRAVSDTPWSPQYGTGPYTGDTAFKFKRGCVAPDGAIWNQPNERIGFGRVSLEVGEREKAERFGWRFVEKNQVGLDVVERVQPR